MRHKEHRQSIQNEEDKEENELAGQNRHTADLHETELTSSMLRYKYRKAEHNGMHRCRNPKQLSMLPTNIITIKQMKSKLGGLSSYIASTTPRERMRSRDDRDETQSRGSRRVQHQQSNKNKYHDLDQELDFQPRTYRQYAAENEEEREYAKNKERRDAPALKRTSSKKGLQHSGSSKNILQRSKVQGKFSQEGIEDWQTEDESRLRLTRHHSDGSEQNFQHMRQETKQYMETLRRRVGGCLQTINQVMAEFKKSLQKVVEDEYNKLEMMVKEVVDNIFSSELENISRMCRGQQRKVSKSFADLKDELEGLATRLQKMREGTEGPNWKRYTGDFFRDDIEGQVDSLMRRCERLQTPRKVYMNFDPRKVQQFKTCLHGLLQVQLSVNTQDNP